MKNIIITISVLLISTTLLAKTNILGRVTDKENKNTIIGAVISLYKDGKIIVGELSDDMGEYKIKASTGESYVIRVSFLGYKTIEDTIQVVTREMIKDFQLEEQAFHIDEVIVRGSGQNAEINKIKQSPMAVSVVNGLSLRGRSTGINDVLSRTSGIKIRQSGGMGSSSRISIHGLEGKRVAVFIDGFELDSPDGSFDLNDIPVDVIKYIEVYKGIVPAEYGGDGLGGAINIVTREDDCDLVGFTQEVSSYNSSKTLVTFKKLFKESGIQLGGGIFYNRSDNNYRMNFPHYDPYLPTDIYQTVERNNDFYRAGMAVVELVFTKLWFDKMKIELAAYKNEKGIQSFDFDSRSAFTHGTNIMPSLELEKKDFILKGLNFKYGMVTPFINSHLVDTANVRHQWNGNTTNTAGETLDNIMNLSDDKQKEVRARLNLKYSIEDNHIFNFNNQFSYAKFIPDDPFVADYVGFNPSGFPSKATFNAAGFAYNYIGDNKRFQNSLNVSLYTLNSKIFKVAEKNETTHNTPPNGSVTQIHWGFSEGISYEFFKGFRGKFSYAHAVRLPATSELFGDGNLIIPSIQLQPEISNNLNLGLIFDRRNIWNLSHIQFDANIYHMDIQDMISLQPINAVRLTYDNLGRITIKGVDADLKLDITDNIYCYYNITYQQIMDNLKWKDDDESVTNQTYKLDVPNIPTFYYNYGIEYHAEGLLGKNEISRVYLDGSYVREYNWAWQMDSDSEQQKKWIIPSSHIISVGIQQSFWNNKVSIAMEVENIFDTELYQEYNQPLAGRMLKLKLRFNWFRDKISGGAMGI